MLRDSPTPRRSSLRTGSLIHASIITTTAAKFCVSACIVDRIRLSVSQPIEWQRIGNQINAAMIFAQASRIELLAGMICCIRSRDSEGLRIYRFQCGGSVWKPLQIPDSVFERLGIATLRLCVYRVSDRVRWLALQFRGAAGQAAA
jgi:hypothetical protein